MILPAAPVFFSLCVMTVQDGFPGSSFIFLMNFSEALENTWYLFQTRLIPSSRFGERGAEAEGAAA